MTASPSLDDLARALDKARAAHESRPTDANYTAMLEAQVALQKAQLRERDRKIARERSRATEIARRLKRAQALLESARPLRRRRRTADAGLPLLEHCDVPA